MVQATIPAPRVILVIPSQWPRALLRAALREAGYRALGTAGLSTAQRFPTVEADQDAVRLVVVDQAALAGRESDQVDRLLSRHPEAAAVLLAPATQRIRGGPWRRIIRRPASVADVLAVVQSLVPLPLEARQPVE
jgi:hypothetical protein